MNYSSVSKNNFTSSPTLGDETKPNLKIYNEKSVLDSLITMILSEKIKKDLFELMENTTQDVIGDNWQNYVTIKDPKFLKELCYSPNQERYGNWMHHSVKMGRAGLKEKEWSFKELLEFLSFARHHTGQSYEYGQLRRVGTNTIKSLVETSIFESGPYMAVYEFYKNYLPDGKTCKLKNVSEDSKQFNHVSCIDQEKIKLSQIFIFKYPRNYGKRISYGCVSHTRFKKIAKIMNFVESELYSKAIEENEKQPLIKDLGRLFWWICQAKPWQLGDPSIAEMLIRTIWASKGFEQPGWKAGVIPWVEVTNEPNVEIFAENFHSLFK